MSKKRYQVSLTGSIFHKPILTDINYITLFNFLLLESLYQPFQYFAQDKHQVDRAIITQFVLFTLFINWHNITFLPGFWNLPTDRRMNIISVPETGTCHNFKNCLGMHGTKWLQHLLTWHRMCIKHLTKARSKHQEWTSKKAR